MGGDWWGQKIEVCLGLAGPQCDVCLLLDGMPGRTRPDSLQKLSVSVTN